MDIKIKIRKTLNNFELDIDLESGDRRIGILGASGCGKSMTLKAVAGIVTPDSGRIDIGGKEFFNSEKKVNVSPQKRRIGYLFQNYALFPTMTVAQNIAAGLHGSKEENEKKVQEMIRRFRLGGLESQLPRSLSGGQQQRVALARLMAYDPEMILLDEPFSAMDAHLKDQLQQQLSDMLSDFDGTVILVSHNRDEIYRFCSELVIMDKGHIISHGPTKEIFRDPGNKYAAVLTGCKNFTDIKRIDEHTCELIDWGAALHLNRSIPEGTTSIGYRAHYFEPVWVKPGEAVPANCVKAELADMANMPFEINYYFKPQGEVRPGNPEQISWFVRKGGAAGAIKEKGLPDYLKLDEEHILFLK